MTHACVIRNPSLQFHCNSPKTMGVTIRLPKPSEVQVSHPMTYSQGFKTMTHRKLFSSFSFLYSPLSFCCLLVTDPRTLNVLGWVSITEQCQQPFSYLFVCDSVSLCSAGRP